VEIGADLVATVLVANQIRFKTLVKIVGILATNVVARINVMLVGSRPLSTIT
jgi:hypothetical protein